jgi:transposase-like protein
MKEQLSDHDIQLFLKSLTAEQLNDLKEQLQSPEDHGDGTLEELAQKGRFSHGVVCPYCKSMHTKRNGHRKDGVQKHVCNDCHTHFVATTGTIYACSKLPRKKWDGFFQFFCAGLTVRQIAGLIHVNKMAAWLMRIKVNHAIAEHMLSLKAEGVTEADESFFDVSYKGQERKDGVKARKRGGIKGGYMGTASKVCVPCIVDRSGTSISLAKKLGAPDTKTLCDVLKEHAAPGSTLCTDGEKAYIKATRSCELSLVQIAEGKGSKGIYNIQHVNSLHNQLKKQINSTLNGVATKYLQGYLASCSLLFGERKEDRTVWDKVESIASSIALGETLESIRDLSECPYQLNPEGAKLAVI